MSEVTRAFGHVFRACFAFELSVYGTEKGIVEATIARLCTAFVHGLWVKDMANAHSLDFLRRQESKLDLPDRLDRRTRVREDEVRHVDVGSVPKSMESCAGRVKVVEMNG